MEEDDVKTCKKCGFKGSAQAFHGRLCGQCRKQQRNAHYQSNKIDLLNLQHTYYQDNKGHIKQQKKVYYETNKSIILQKHKNYERIKLATDPVFRLRKMASTVIRTSLKEIGSKKSSKSISKYLGYSFIQLKEHLEQQFEPWMSWDNYKKYDPKIWDDNNSATWTWTLDHIIPQADLPYTSMDDENFRKCWALNNLRPLSAKQNLLDGALRIRHSRIK